jgi:hypothetical protein
MPALILVLGSAGTASAQYELHKFTGSSGDEYFGIAVGGAGDVNADGYADLIVGQTNSQTYYAWASGTAHVLSGIDGSLLYWLDEGSGGPWFYGDQFGRAVAGAGDLDGDGFGEVIVGAPRDDPGGLERGTA